MVTIDDPTVKRTVRGKPRFVSKEDGEQWLEKQTNKGYIVVKNPYGDDFYLRKRKK